MVQVKSITCNPGTMEADVFLIADTKAEVANTELKDIKGFPAGYSIEFGSKVMTTSGELAIMKSNGAWNWGDN